jgi:hypothetical protein
MPLRAVQKRRVRRRCHQVSLRQRHRHFSDDRFYPNKLVYRKVIKVLGNMKVERNEKRIILGGR